MTGGSGGGSTSETKPQAGVGGTFTVGHKGSSKKTLQLVSGSRRKVRGATLSTLQTTTPEVNTSSNTLSLGKRIRSQASRRISGPSVAKTFKCHLDTCGKVFNDRASLKKHMTVHGDKLVSSGCQCATNEIFLLKWVQHSIILTISPMGSSSATMRVVASAF